MNSYCILSKQVFSEGEYTLVPIRYKDRYNIMDWRNDQMYHLRQNNILTKRAQNEYFNSIISPSFDQKTPSQILFSLLKNKECIGYGGLVHIDWNLKIAEISFLIKTSLEKEYFDQLWNVFLTMIENIAFDYLDLKKIITFSYELRPDLYPILTKHDFKEEKRIQNHIKFKGKSIDALIHYKETVKLSFRKIKHSDKLLLFNWVNDEYSLKNSIHNEPISWEDHQNWFDKKLKNPNTLFYIFQFFSPVGVVRLDNYSNAYRISFSVDKNYRRRGLGNNMIKTILKLNPNQAYIAEVLSENTPSHKIFLKNNFIFQDKFKKNGQEICLYKKV